jgi:transglutaminase 1
VELSQRILVIFDPWSAGDEFYANLTHVEKEQTLFKESGGIWAAGNNPVFWTFGQFSEPSWQLAMLLLDDIPLNQRGMGARVVRWITYFIPTILQGRWCSPPKCFDDGTRPWAWQSSLPIFQQYLRTRQPVKYAQCWIFAGCATSIYRAMGVAARTVSNYNSAHGSTKNNGGVESFYFYGNDYQLSARSIPQNSIWTFHVWTEVYMKRLDLAERASDGWQVADATPQEEACVPTPGGQTACRFMMGPASVNMARLGPNSAEIKDPYDTRFLVGETVGALRSWRPKYINWRTCPATCVRNSIGDGNCDAACNIKGCDWDMGDCCANTCSGILPIRPFACGGSGYSCKGLALGWTMLYLPDRTFIGRSLTTQRPGGAWNQPLDITRSYKVV